MYAKIENCLRKRRRNIQIHMFRVVATLIVIAVVALGKVALEANLVGIVRIESLVRIADKTPTCETDLAWVAKWNGFKEQCCTFGVIHYTYEPSTGNSHLTTHPTHNSLTLCKYLTAPGVACRVSQECISRTCFVNKTCA